MKKGLLLMIVIIAIIAIIVHLVYNYTELLSKYIPKLRISIPEARARRFQLILDVRTEKEREMLGYYPNSIPLPISNLNEIKGLTSNLNISILVYSNGDKMAEHAAYALYNMGYHNVRYITSTYISLLPGR